MLKPLLGALLKVLFRVDARGLENLGRAGERALIVANHVSLMDAALLALYLPGRPTFAINTEVAKWWWVRPFLGMVDALPIDPTNPMAVRTLARRVEEGRRVVIFPEGRITVTGALMKVYDGPGMIADRTGADVVPVRIDGAQYTFLSYLRGRLRRRLLPRIRLTVQTPRKLEIAAGLRGRARRRAAGERLYDMLSDMLFETGDTARTLPLALLDAIRNHGGRRPRLEDVDRKPIGLRRIALGALVLGRRLAGMTEKGEAVGVLLPNAVGTVVTLFALMAWGRVPAMLNFTAGLANIRSGCAAARVNLVLTSRRFVEAARLEGLVASLAESVKIVYLDDLRAEIGPGERMLGLVSLPFARALFARRAGGPDSPALVLFTSGSEGNPKGVVLSHRNILANCHQAAARLDYNEADTVLACLPLFHAFGLTGGLLLPLLWGVRVFLYPSPLHYRKVPEAAYETGATILFGTDTFLAGYARMAHPYDFRSVRYVFAGAEKVRDETRRAWMEKFGLRLLEGYGATETAPVVAVNTPIHYRVGTVGRVLPGIECRLDPVEGIEEGGRLVVKGPNVMLGYLRHDTPGEVQPPEGGWYDTGDIVAFDADGYLRILGRAKRFAKVAGEMVSLGQVEERLMALWPDHGHAILAVPDERRGEGLVLVTTRPGTTRAEAAESLRAEGVTELALPRTVLVREKLPMLATGKIDYVTLGKELRA